MARKVHSEPLRKFRVTVVEDGQITHSVVVEAEDWDEARRAILDSRRFPGLDIFGDPSSVQVEALDADRT